MARSSPAMDEGVLQALLSSSNGRRRGDLCKYASILAELDPPVRAAYEEAARQGVGGSAISASLRKLGFAVSKPVVIAHNQGECRCPLAE